MSAAETTTEYDALAAFYVSETGMENPHLAGGSELVSELAKLGVGSVFVSKEETEAPEKAPSVLRGCTARIQEGRLELDDDTQELSLGAYYVGGIAVVRSRIATPAGFETVVPVINGPGIRALGGHREQHDLFGEYMPDTVWAEPGEAFDEALESITTELVVVKSNVGLGNRYNSVGLKTEAPTMIEDLRRRRENNGLKDHGFVIQAYDPGRPIEGLQLLHESQQGIATALDDNRNTELRTYCFADNVKGDLRLRPYSLYHVDPGEPHGDFVPVAQDSLPESHIELVQHIAEKVLREAGVSGALFAVDTYGPTASRLREVNVKDPGIGSVLRKAKDTITDDIRTQQVTRLAELLNVLARAEKHV